jgi:adenylate cyclase
MATLHFDLDNRDVDIAEDQTILKASLDAGIPHIHVCGGHARCSTCRVLVLEGVENCLPRNADEQRMADRLRFDNTLRLACQTRVIGNVKLRRLVLDHDDEMLTSQFEETAVSSAVGEEKEVAILFCDIRGFTSFSEILYPYDVIHVLNRYFTRMEQVVAQHGGEVDNYLGDGLMVRFDDTCGAHPALCAVRAGLDMLAALEDINPYVQNLHNRPIQIGIGIHYGTVVVGTLGTAFRRITAIGDNVNLASRIESANKEIGTRFLISSETYELVKDHIEARPHYKLTIKGKSGTFCVYEVLKLK